MCLHWQVLWQELITVFFEAKVISRNKGTQRSVSRSFGVYSDNGSVQSEPTIAPWMSQSLTTYLEVSSSVLAAAKGRTQDGIGIITRVDTRGQYVGVRNWRR